jgi:exoribonuclease R
VPARQIRFIAPDALVEQGLEKVRTQWDMPESFPAEVVAEARATQPVMPAEDLTQIPFVTIDPPGARDLDQALHIERSETGFRVSYAIADVAAFVHPGGALDGEARTRGLTMYAPDRNTPLYPKSLSEGEASLLPDEDRPAVVWVIDLDGDGEIAGTAVRRALIRSREQLDYGSVQGQIDAGSATPSLSLLAEVGRLRQLIEVDRGAVTLPIPEQLVVRSDGGWDLVYRTPLPVESWNAQISLLTGMAAAQYMVEGGVGILRTLSPAEPGEVEWLGRVARALRVTWPERVGYPEMIRSLNARIPSHAALLAEATSLFSGAGYQVLEPGAEALQHAALATTYAHATAPLRRLVDRFVSETCLALHAGEEVPEWVIEALPSLPDTMSRAASIAGSYEAACRDVIEAAILTHREGELFDGVVVNVDTDNGRGELQLRKPAVHARIDDSDLQAGEQIQVRLVSASVPDRKVVFERV